MSTEVRQEGAACEGDCSKAGIAWSPAACGPCWSTHTLSSLCYDPHWKQEKSVGRKEEKERSYCGLTINPPSASGCSAWRGGGRGDRNGGVKLSLGGGVLF